MFKPEVSGDETAEWQPPTEEEIRRRAYEIYLERVRECGGPLDDWLEAEAQLFMKRARNNHIEGGRV